ncbi:hypothetical protein [Phenylobacterium sp.]|uniref:hypothetical protein n=1 Tax=Phenylobacterium sp. TaxID=1871053 RepID=UPI0035B47408
MHVTHDPSKLRSLAAQLMENSTTQAGQATDKSKKRSAAGVGGASAAQDVAAATAGGGAPRSPQALFSALENSAGRKLRPQGGPDKQFGAETLDALVKAQAAMEDLAGKIVERLDADGDDAFSLDELKSALPGKSGEAPGRASRAEKLFERLDADGDGKVTLAELTSLFAPKPEEEEPAPVETAQTAETATPEVIDPTKAGTTSGA